MTRSIGALSKSRILNALQCAKRAWLETHQPQLAVYESATEAAFENGQRIGRLAIDLYGADGGTYVDYDGRNLAPALAETDRLMSAPRSGGAATPIFEATLQHQGVLVREDVLLPTAGGGWRVVEVKSSTRVKDVHVEDCAVQAWVHLGAGHRLDAIALAHVNNQWVRPASIGRPADDPESYQGLLVEEDLTERVLDLQTSVPSWVEAARAAVEGPEPRVPVGHQCTQPFECPFMGTCWPDRDETAYPVQGLGGRKDRLGKWIRAGYRDIRDVPPSAISAEQQLRIRRVTAGGEPELLGGAQRFVDTLAYPRFYLDFEAVGPPIPLFPGTRPYQALPFQYSCHIERAPGVPRHRLEHREFLDLSPASASQAQGPMRALAEALVRDLEDEGPVLMYSDYERKVINTLIELLPDRDDPLAERLTALRERLVDLHPVVKQNYYHPDMLGSWSIKAVLPTIARSDEDRLDYADLDGIAEGMGAAEAYLEAIDPATTPERRAEIGEQLRAYCRRDTEAMVRVVGFLSGAVVQSA